MSRRTYTVKEVARHARVTVRTLHHYDSIGLLVPARRSPSGYRLYTDDDLLRLQQILIGRELDMPLERIKRMLDDPSFDRRRALLEQREHLVKRAGETEAMIRSIDAALETMKGEIEMEPKKLFDGFDPAKYEEEVKKRWGHTDAYKESSRRVKKYTEEDWTRINAENASLMKALSVCMIDGKEARSEEVMNLAEKHRLHIDRWYYPCSRMMHSGLAGMYVADERFRAAFEKYGEGLAEYLAEAIRANAERG